MRYNDIEYNGYYAKYHILQTGISGYKLRIIKNENEYLVDTWVHYL